MALLMYMYQKFKLTREVNELSRKQLAIQNKKSRVTKNIERVQKRYTSLFQQIKTQASQMEKMFNVQIQEMMGLGMSGFNQFGFYGPNAFTDKLIRSWCENGHSVQKDKDGNVTATITTQDYEDLLNKQASNQSLIDADGKPIDGYTKEQIELYQNLMRSAQNAQQQAQWQASRQQQQMSMNVSIWQQAAEAQLELQQEQETEPLEYEDTMLALEETSVKTLLEMKKQQLKECEEGVKEGIQSMGA